MACEGRHDKAGNFVLNIEHVTETSVVSLGPNPLTRAGVDQLRHDPQAIAGFTYSADNEMRDTKTAAQFDNIPGGVVSKARRRECNHKQVAETG